MNVRDIITSLFVGWLFREFLNSQSSAPTSKPKAPTKTSSSDRAAILGALSDLSWPRAELDAAIRIESGWNPAAVNPTSHAVGLIQFMPRTLQRLGYGGTWQEFARLGALQQLPWIRKYLSRWSWRVPGDTYLALAYPAALGKPDDELVAMEGSPIWNQNPSWRSPGNGPVNAGSIRAVLLRRLSSAKA